MPQRLVYSNGILVSSTTFERDPADVNATDLRDKAAAAISANIAYLAIASPTNAQVVAHVARLTRENTAIIRLMLNALEDTAGT